MDIEDDAYGIIGVGVIALGTDDAVVGEVDVADLQGVVIDVTVLLTGGEHAHDGGKHREGCHRPGIIENLAYLFHSLTV